MLSWQPNKIVTGHKKHLNWVDNLPMTITAKYGSYHFNGYGENAIYPFSHISLWDFSVARATKPRDRLADF